MRPGYASAYSRANVRFASWARKQHPAEWRAYLNAQLALLPDVKIDGPPQPTIEPPAVADPPKQTIDERRAAFQADQEAKRMAAKEVRRKEALADNGLARRRAANLANIDKEREELSLRLEKIKEEKVRRAAAWAAELDEP